MLGYLLFFLSCVEVIALNASECYNSGHDKDICEYMETFSKSYLNHSEIKLRGERIVIAKQSQNRIFGRTSRSDMFPHEHLQNKYFLKHVHDQGNLRKEKNIHVHLGAPKSLPPIDWRNVSGVSYVTPVRTQGACGACYAFAATATLEYWSMKSEPLSVEHLLDCSSTAENTNDGCEGGLMEYVFEYAMKRSVVSENDGPYFWGMDACPRHDMYSHVSVLNWKVIGRQKNAENELEWLLHAYGPVTIGVDSRNWDNYIGGTFTHDLCDTKIDHAVTIVGYTENTWIVKNSWGTDWGVDGYIYLERGHNTCGLSEYIVYVTDAVPLMEYRPSLFF